MIRNVIFDVGGVLLEYRWRDLMKESGATDEIAEAVASITFSDPAWRAMDRGEMTLAETREHFVTTYPKYGDVMEYFLSHPEGMDVDRPAVWEKMKLVKEAGYKIYILSNFSRKGIEEAAKELDYMSKADGAVISYEVKMIKPDPGIYEYLLKKYDIDPEKAVFIDDNKDNIEAAQKLGIRGILFKGKKDADEQLAALGVVY